ncbi:urate hydroxylase PuuD, partial [Pseudomonas aeruginosa]
AYGLTQVFSGRGAYLHVGAIIGTIMVGNVFRVIMPAQRRIAEDGVDEPAADQRTDTDGDGRRRRQVA